MEFLTAASALGLAFVALTWRFAMLAFLPQPPSNSDVMQWGAFGMTLWALWITFNRNRRQEARNERAEAEAESKTSLTARIVQLEGEILTLRNDLSEAKRHHVLCQDEIRRLNRLMGSKSWIIPAPPGQPPDPQNGT